MIFGIFIILFIAIHREVVFQFDFEIDISNKNNISESFVVKEVNYSQERYSQGR